MSDPWHARSNIRPGVVILAAGSSARMGRPKLLLPWGDTTVLAHLLGTWERLGAKHIAIVCTGQNEALHSELDRLRFPTANRLVNPTPERGMFSSIQCAAGWIGWAPELSHWVISLGDQPHLRFQTLETLLEFAASHPGQICQPAHRGRGRHPVLLPRAFMADLATSNVESFKHFLQAHSETLIRCEMNDPGLDLDMDTPAEYQRALAQAGLFKP